MYNVATFECEIESAKQKERYGDEDLLDCLLQLRSLPIYRPLPENKMQVCYFSWVVAHVVPWLKSKAV